MNPEVATSRRSRRRRSTLRKNRTAKTVTRDTKEMIGNGGGQSQNQMQDFMTDRDNREVQQQQVDEPQIKQFKENIITQKDMETEVLDQISTVTDTPLVTMDRFKSRMRYFYIVIQSALVTVRYFQQNILYEVQQVEIHHVSRNDKETPNYHIISSRTRNRALVDSHNDGSNYLVHRLASNFQEILYTLLAESHKHALDSKQVPTDRKLDIFIGVQEDLSVRITLPRAQILIDAAAVEEIAEGINFNSSTGDEETDTKCWTEEECNEYLDSTFTTAFSGYLGDTEDEIETKDLRGNVNKNLRKKFGVYPEYRIRLNGVRYITLDSSDEDELEHLSEQAYRGSRKSIKRNNLKWSKFHEVTMDSVSSSEDKSNGEESEPVIVHIVSAKKNKLPSKRRFHAEEVDTTASEASDVESLTDCSLCCGDGSP